MESEAPIWTQRLIDSVINLIIEFGNIVVSVAGLIIIVVIIIGGVQYIIGQPENGKKTILAGIIGALIITLSWAIIASIGGLLR